MIYLGADHRGFKLKEQVKAYLVERGYQVTDLGTNSEEPVDYPLITEKVAVAVKGDPNNRGIVICGSGVGVCIVANKIKTIRAAEAWSPEVAHAARNDDNVNVLCLSSDNLDFEQSKPIVQAFLDTSFGAEDRYKRRLKQIEDIEKNN